MGKGKRIRSLAAERVRREKERLDHELPNQTILSCLENLRHDVENQGMPKIKLIGSVYRERGLAEIRTTVVGNWEFGYRVAERPDIGPRFFERRLFIKRLGEPILSVSELAVERVINAVYTAILDQAGTIPEIEILNEHAILITQVFEITMLVERTPGIRVPTANFILGKFKGKF